MGPRHLSRGNNAAIENLDIQLETLQWGHGISAVEIDDWRDPKVWIKALQWGHGISAVEIQEGETVQRTSNALQWGHGISAVEMRWRRARPSR